MAHLCEQWNVELVRIVGAAIHHVDEFMAIHLAVLERQHQIDLVLEEVDRG